MEWLDIDVIGLTKRCRIKKLYHVLIEETKINYSQIQAQQISNYINFQCDEMLTQQQLCEYNSIEKKLLDDNINCIDLLKKLLDNNLIVTKKIIDSSIVYIEVDVEPVKLLNIYTNNIFEIIDSYNKIYYSPSQNNKNFIAVDYFIDEIKKFILIKNL